jgi:hypothetical protein
MKLLKFDHLVFGLLLLRPSLALGEFSGSLLSDETVHVYTPTQQTEAKILRQQVPDPNKSTSCQDLVGRYENTKTSLTIASDLSVTTSYQVGYRYEGSISHRFPLTFADTLKEDSYDIYCLAHASFIDYYGCQHGATFKFRRTGQDLEVKAIFPGTISHPCSRRGFQTIPLLFSPPTSPPTYSCGLISRTSTGNVLIDDRLSPNPLLVTSDVPAVLNELLGLAAGDSRFGCVDGTIFNGSEIRVWSLQWIE